MKESENSGIKSDDVEDRSDAVKSTDLRSPAENEKLIDAVTDLFENRITFNGFLGFRLEALQADKVIIQFPMRPELVGHYLYGRLHGGVISSVLDATGGLAVIWKIAEFYKSESTLEIMSRFRHLGTVDMRVDYLRQGIGETFYAEAEVVRLGRRIAATSMRLRNEENVLIATGNANYIVS